MKKIYKTPETEVTVISAQLMIASSPGGNDEIGSGEELVKERHDDFLGGRDVSNVWDDDWSR